VKDNVLRSIGRGKKGGRRERKSGGRGVVRCRRWTSGKREEGRGRGMRGKGGSGAGEGGGRGVGLEGGLGEGKV